MSMPCTTTEPTRRKATQLSNDRLKNAKIIAENAIKVRAYFHVNFSTYMVRDVVQSYTDSQKYFIVTNILLGTADGPIWQLKPMGRDQLNSRFHGRDIFREIDLLPRQNVDFREIHDFFVNFSAFSLIYDNS